MALRMTKVASDPSLGDIIGQDFGPYRLVRRLGVGGMAQTFEAIRHGPGDFSQRVCLKLVLPFFRDNQAFVELFKQEAKLAAKLRHSNIVGVIDFGEIDGTLYMALELVDGADLQVLLDAQDRKRLPHEHVALVGRDLARALEHAHNPPGTGNDGHDLGAIIHRDISPSNVMISRHGEVLLTDFGVAKAVTDTQGEQSNVKGKIPYMSPEQLMGEALDGRADLFALGVVLFEALTGKRPYAGANEPATIMLALAGDHVPLSELAPGTPLELRRVIESLLEPDREERPQDAATLVELLDEIAPPSRVRRELGKMVARTPAAETRRVESGVGRSGGGVAPGDEVGLAEAATAPAVDPATPAARRSSS
jgi:serine/threonine protein kinase